MSKSKQPPHAAVGALVLVCDGRKALLFRNLGSPVAPRLQLIEKADAPPNPATHVQGADQPGRLPSSQGRGSSVDQTDWHEEAERAFAVRTAEWLDEAVRKDPAADLVLVAPPRTLATLRDHLSPSVRQGIAGEFAADLTRHSVPDIEEWLALKETP